MPATRRRTLLFATLILSTLLVFGGTSTPPAAADGNEAPGAPVGFRSISGGSLHACALLSDAQVKCWGGGTAGQLGQGNSLTRGDGPGEMGSALVRAGLGTGRSATAVTAGSNHTCALLDDATVKCWGANSDGQLGQGSTTNLGDAAGEMGNALPAVALGSGRTATAISAGASHTCALLDNGTVKCWGANNSGQLGQGTTTNTGDGANEMGDDLPPVALGTGRTATAIATGASFTCALPI